MKYFVLRGVSQRTKTITSFALALLMVFQAIGPGVFALKTARAAGPTLVNLGSAGNFVILSKSGITTTGATSITGDIGVSPIGYAAITGFSLIPTVPNGSNTFSTSAMVIGKVYASDYTSPTPSNLTTAVSDMEAAYTDATGRTPGTGASNLNVGGGTLSGYNFVPGTYTWNTTSSNISITGDITLTGSATDVWIFQIAGTLGIEAGKKIILAGGALPQNIFWAVAGTTTLKPGSTFEGIILGGPGASTIALQSGAILHGRALGQKNVTLIANTVSVFPSTTATISATKIVCDKESDLPDWGDGSHSQAGITATTATDWIAQHAGCHLQSDWQFQYGNSSATDAGMAFTGPAGSPWMTFNNPTGVNGVTTQNIDLSNIGSPLWVREVLQSGYIPFTYDTQHPDNTNSVSAEMYCGNDVLHYDNYEQIPSPKAGNTYYCVAWNVASHNLDKPCITPVAVQDGDKITSFGVSPEPTLQQILDTAYGTSTIQTATQETGIQAWTIPAGTNSVIFSGKFIAAYAGNRQEFGYYFDGNLSTFTPIFRQSGHNGVEQTLNAGDAIPSFTVNTAGHTSIGFVIDTQQGTSTARYATEKSLNGGDDHAVVYNNPNNAKGYVIAFEDLPFIATANFPKADKDYQDLVVELNVDRCTKGGNECVPSSGTVSSNATATFTGNDGSGNAVLLSTINPAWTASSSDLNAKWIWSHDPVSSPTSNNDTETFTKTFNITGNPTSGSIDIAADNYYKVLVNGNVIASSTTDTNFAATATFNIPASDLTTGTNTLVVIGENEGVKGSDPTSNPAGVLFSLTWKSDCGNGGGGGGDHGTSVVHVEKFVDGNLATFEDVGAPAFPIHAGLGGAQQFDGVLNSGNDYSWDSNVVPNTTAVDVYEKTDGIDGIVVGSVKDCSVGKYYIDGYTSSDSGFDTNHDNLSSKHQSFDPISSHDKYIVIWNKTCPTTAHVFVSKIICPTESDLPNWGLGTGPAIGSTTASDFLATHKDCQKNTDWQFQWGPSTSTDPGGAVTGVASAPWSSAFSGSTDVPLSVLGGAEIHMREVLKSGYIPFTYDLASSTPNGNNFSAEIYCSTDHLNYDNFDFIRSPAAGQTYYCVAWNVPTTPTGTITVVKHTIGGNGTFNFVSTTTPNGATGIQSFSIQTNNNSGTTTFTGLPAGVYTISEVSQPQWTFDSSHCVYDNLSIGISTFGGQKVTLEGGADVTCTFTNTATPQGGGPTNFTLTTTINQGSDQTNDGTGSVLGDNSPNNIDCSNVSKGKLDATHCVKIYPAGTVVILTETPGSGSTFTDSWSGACTGNATTCQVTMNSNQSVNAHFTLNKPPVIITSTTGGGGGGGGGGGFQSSGFGAGGGGGGGGSIAGASSANPGEVLGATTDLPGLPNTGDGQRSQTLTVTLALIVALVAVNMLAIRGVTRKNSR